MQKRARKERTAIFLPSKEQKTCKKKTFAEERDGDREREKERETHIYPRFGRRYWGALWPMKYRIKGPPPKTGFILETDAPATRFPPQSGTFFEPSREEREPQPLFEWDCFSIPLLLLFLYSLSLFVAPISRHEALWSRVSSLGRIDKRIHTHDGRALIGYPASGREQPPSKEGTEVFVKKITGFEGI